MNASELTFGIEIETIAPTSAIERDGLQIGSYHRGIQVPYLPTGWKAERDGSIDASAGGHACEIVSPILRGAEGLAEVAEVARILEAKGHRVNVSTGVHVHIGWNDEWPAEALARLVTIVAYAERGLYAITGTKNRERSRYCGGIRKYGNGKDAKPVLDSNRYHALNLTRLAMGGDTVEFRVFSGSINATKLVAWIQICLGLVERAIETKRSPKWSPAPLRGGWRKSGDGASEAERLLGFLAWGDGYAKAHGGRRFGWIAAEATATIDAAKNELRRLAAKYDAQP